MGKVFSHIDVWTAGLCLWLLLVFRYTGVSDPAQGSPGASVISAEVCAAALSAAVAQVNAADEDKPARAHAKKSLPPAGQCLNVNVAAASALQTLPGIGAVLAQRIVEFRKDHGPFAIAADLKKVRGIGNAKLAKITQGICF